MLLHAYGMGGTIRTVFAQANAMAARGHDVEIVSAVRRRTKPQFALDPRVKLSAVVDERAGRSDPTLGERVMRRVRGKVVPAGEFAARYFTPQVEKAVVEYVRGLTDGILVTTRPALNLVSARYAAPQVVKVGQEHLNLGTHKDPVRRAIHRHYAKLDVVAVLTRTDQADYERAAPGLRTVQIPNAVSIHERKRAELVNPRAIAAGRLYPQKGFDMLISAFDLVAREHPGWTLDIFGEGPRKERFQGLIDQNADPAAIRLRGRTTTLDRELADSSIYVLSSRFEGLPMVMLEAMGHGLAVAAFDCPTGPADIIEDGVNGLLVPHRDVVALARAVGRLIEDPALRARLGAAALRTAQEYTPEQVMPRWERLFADLLAEKQK
ncbi:glycosyltransferase family 4 protein [Acrocarpospora catenulata]|uniref:glycosyltransferase family 4 protein n=1 Tax=Acrocarpospora catenulata TaxID=2836182 RepID=UPI002023927D|nr:glycosyltransferase family 4 protein [Acrocarpospora catenulata]